MIVIAACNRHFQLCCSLHPLPVLSLSLSESLPPTALLCAPPKPTEIHARQQRLRSSEREREHAPATMVQSASALKAQSALRASLTAVAMGACLSS